MQSIGIRELRQHASRYLRLVEAGETVQVTDRGRPVALLVPAAREEGYDQLVAAGRIRPATGRMTDLGPALPAAPGQSSISDALDELRQDER